MRILSISGCLIGLLAGLAAAEPAKFPYEAIIQSDDVYVRSGPGKRYYPTGKLAPGARVIVHRHDPGGWFMIAPPAGSFSWILQRHITPTGPDTGTVNANNAVVRVGSFESDVRDVEQRRLSTGDTVKIIAEKTLTGEKGPEKWYQIQPPAGEYRWILGQFVTPLAAAGQAPPNGNAPIAAAPPRERTPAAASEEVFDLAPAPFPQASNGTPSTPVARSGPTAEQLALDRQQLRTLDGQFETVLKADATQWDFTPVEQGYLALQQQSQQQVVQRLIEQRLATIQEYRSIQQDYREFVQLTSRTEQRDKQLLAIQQNGGIPAAPVSAPGPTAPPPAAPPAQPPVPSAPVPPQATQRLSPAPTPAAGPQTQVTRQPIRFDGAGIIQRSATTYPGAPRHVLLTPNGRVLAYLRPVQGLDLDQFLGQSMGLYGRRSYDAQLRADVIIVQQLTRVRLAP